MTKTYDVITTVEVTIKDEDIPTMLKDYRGCINDSGSLDDMMKHIAWNEARWEGQFCEGCGDNGKDFMAEITGSEVEEY